MTAMPMDWKLTANEARVLGSLLEKQITTPEYYPLSLAALVHACNQRSNRFPITDLDEDAVRLALRNLQEKGLAAARTDARVAKFEHRLPEVLNLTRGQNAVLCLLLLRGPQTPGKLRGRADRLHAFAELEQVQAVLQQLIEHQPALVAALPRAPGTKETRYMHLLSGAEAAWEPAAAGAVTDRERIARLEGELEELRQAVGELLARLAGAGSSSSI